jgi:hypothetical protein
MRRTAGRGSARREGIGDDDCKFAMTSSN